MAYTTWTKGNVDTVVVCGSGTIRYVIAYRITSLMSDT